MKKIKTFMKLVMMFALLSTTYSYAQSWNTDSPSKLCAVDSAGVDSTVKVGIGTSNPLSTLDVNGDAIFRKYALFNDSIRVKGDLHIGESSLIFKSKRCTSYVSPTNELIEQTGIDEIRSTCGRIKMGGEPNIKDIRLGIGINPTTTLDVFGEGRFGSGNGNIIISNNDGYGSISSNSNMIVIGENGGVVEVGSNNEANFMVNGKASIGCDIDNSFGLTVKGGIRTQ